MNTGNGGITAEDFLPAERTLATLKQAAQDCRGCGLYKRASQTVFGEGHEQSRLMFVGETPGNDEDLCGKPFVGPAGRLLNEALDAVGIARNTTYVTNVVKHFKWERRGTRRLHKTPNAQEIKACLPWLEAEIALVQPQILVCLGATAAKALIGPDFRVSRQHGQILQSNFAAYITATTHPSAILRNPNRETRAQAKRQLIEDLDGVRRLIASFEN